MKYNTILHIDDDLDDCEFFKEALQSICEASYLAINNPCEALEKLKNNKLKPDLILLDINMPQMDGCSLLKAIRNNLATVNIPIIIFSTSPNESKNLTSDLDVMYYITKPYNFDDLKKVIRKILGL
ncbi:response regulator [Flavobacterium algicola]|uniref:response regulator n=1 Tax=Flavobacterium algicola TaxID=556529 RepID=UPI001EFDBEB3|nr:response regulator [Flavobacterium algicola]MCG9790876.1 response regulator [Flavobacterium algicola]